MRGWTSHSALSTSPPIHQLSWCLTTPRWCLTTRPLPPPPPKYRLPSWRRATCLRLPPQPRRLPWGVTDADPSRRAAAHRGPDALRSLPIPAPQPPLRLSSGGTWWRAHRIGSEEEGLKPPPRWILMLPFLLAFDNTSTAHASGRYLTCSTRVQRRTSWSLPNTWRRMNVDRSATAFVVFNMS